MNWVKAYLALLGISLLVMLPLGLMGYDLPTLVVGAAIVCGLVVAIASILCSYE